MKGGNNSFYLAPPPSPWTLLIDKTIVWLNKICFSKLELFYKSIIIIERFLGKTEETTKNSLQYITCSIMNEFIKGLTLKWLIDLICHTVTVIIWLFEVISSTISKNLCFYTWTHTMEPQNVINTYFHKI